MSCFDVSCFSGYLTIAGVRALVPDGQELSLRKTCLELTKIAYTLPPEELGGFEGLPSS